MARRLNKFFGWIRGNGERPKSLEPEEQTAPSGSDQRRAYRYEPDPTGDKWIVSVIREAGREYAGDLMDVNVNGVAVRFTLAADPGLKPGDAVELSISSSSRQESVKTPARVVHLEPGGEQHWRYGFEFVSLGNLYAQLDEFYSHVFNRRRHMRVPVPIETRIVARLEWGSKDWFNCHVNDVSVSGMSLFMSEEKASRLEGIERVRVRFALGAGKGELAGNGLLRQRSSLPDGRVLIGVEFDLDQKYGMQKHTEELARYVAQRSLEVTRWERAYKRA